MITAIPVALRPTSVVSEEGGVKPFGCKMLCYVSARSLSPLVLLHHGSLCPPAVCGLCCMLLTVALLGAVAARWPKFVHVYVDVLLSVEVDTLL